MTHVMAKGANIALPVAAVRAVLRWSATPGAPDVDASALLLGPAGKVCSDADFVFYNQPRHPTGLVRHLPKQQSADGSEITDTVEAELGKLPADVDRVVLAGSSEGGSFRAVGGLRLQLFDAAAGEGAPALAEFAMGDGDEVTALVAGELYRRAGTWKFRAVGQGYASGLIGLATDFGITVEDEGGTGAQTATTQPAPAQPGPAADPRTALPDPRPAGRPEPGTFTLAPAVPQPAVPQPAAAQAAPAPAGVPANTPPPPPNPPTMPPNVPPAPTAPPTGQPGYGYPPPNTAPRPPQQGGYGHPQQPPAPGYGYPQQQAPQAPQAPQQGGYGYPPPNTAPLAHQQPPAPAAAEEFALPPQGPQFQPR